MKQKFKISIVVEIEEIEAEELKLPDLELNQQDLEEKWEEIMGKTIAKYTDSIKLENGTLIISSCVKPLQQELLIQKEKLIARVNEGLKGNYVKELEIKIKNDKDEWVQL